MTDHFFPGTIIISDKPMCIIHWIISYSWWLDSSCFKVKIIQKHLQIPNNWWLNHVKSHILTINAYGLNHQHVTSLPSHLAKEGLLLGAQQLRELPHRLPADLGRGRPQGLHGVLRDEGRQAGEIGGMGVGLLKVEGGLSGRR